MDLSYMQDPGFWVVQGVFTFALMFGRLPAELASWLVSKSVRRAVDGVREHATERDDRALNLRLESMLADFYEAPRLLRLIFAVVIVRRVRRIAATFESDPRGYGPASDEPGVTDTAEAAAPVPAAARTEADETATIAAMEVQRPTEQATPDATGPVEALPQPDPAHAGPEHATAPRPPRRPFAVLLAYLCYRLAALAGLIVGGEDGRAYREEMARNLSDTRRTTVRVAYALSNLVGAVQLRLILRVLPFVRSLFTVPDGGRRARLLFHADRIVASDPACAVVTIGLDTAVLTGIWLWFGRQPVLWTGLALAAISPWVLMRLRRAWAAWRASQAGHDGHEPT